MIMSTIREHLLARILRYALYASAFMPLVIFSQYISPFHFGKVVVFRSIVELMLVAYVVLMLQDRSYRPRTNLVFWTFLAFTLAFTLTTFTSVQPYLSFWGTLERMGGLWTFLHYFIFFVIATAVLRKAEHWETLLNLSIFTAVLSAFYGFGQKTDIEFFIGSGGRARIFGTIGNAALFAGYEIINVFLALTLWLRAGNTPAKKVLYASVVGFGTLAVIMTVVRGSILGLGIGYLMFSLWYFLQTGSRKSKLVFLALVTAAVLFGVLLVTPIKKAPFIANSPFLHRLTDTSFDSFTAKTRFWAWEAGLKGWSESAGKMLVGWGPENFNVPFSNEFNPKFFTGYGSETLFDRAHNMFVEILVTMGLVGFVAYLGIFFGAFRSLSRIRKQHPENQLYAIGLSSLIVAYAIHNSFIFDTSANFIAFFIVLGFIAFLAMRGASKDLPVPAPATRQKFILPAVVGIALSIVAIVLIFQTNITQSKANYATTRGIIKGWEGNFTEAMAKFKEAMAYNAPGKYEIRHRAAQYLLEYASGKDVTPEIEQAIKDVIVEVTKNRDENPLDYLPELYLSRLNIILGRNDAQSQYNDIALEHSLRALEISPTFIRTFYEVGQAYLNKKDYDKALEYFKRAAELNPDVGLSFWYWGIVELTRGNTNEALRLINIAFEKGYAASESDYLRISQIYVDRKDYKSLVPIYENLISLNNKNPQYFANLAVVYANVRRIDDAIKMARQAVVLDPNFLAEAQAFARQLGREL